MDFSYSGLALIIRLPPSSSTACTLWFAISLQRSLAEGDEGGTMLWTVFVLLLILWLLGFSFHVAGGLIHLLLVVALVVLVVNLLTGRGATV
jgi:hypothetical protein